MDRDKSKGAWRFDNNRPIFKQIADRLKSDIAGGRFAAGDKFPSVRDLALEIGVNPNTVQRALSSLEEEGILETRRGDGRYVCADEGKRERLALSMTQDVCREFVTVMHSLGLSDCEILDFVKIALADKRERNGHNHE